MNLTNEEAQEINRRVAVALGYSHFTIDAPDGWYAHRPGEKKLSVLPDFCTDPTAADLVRLEIERRGWGWQVGEARPMSPGGEIDGTVYPPKPRKWRAAVSRRSPLKESPHLADSTESPHYVLCLAFLAACEATETE